MNINGKNLCKACFRDLKDGEKCICGYNESDIGQAYFLTPGTLLQGSIHIGKVIGQGNYGITYLAYDEDLELKVAIKEFYLSEYVRRDSSVSNELTFGDEEARQAFLTGLAKFSNEAKYLAKFSMVDGIASIYKYFEANNTGYIVMEYVEGVTLRQVLDERVSLSLEDTLRIMLPVMKTADRMHEEGIIHRDINPYNIMLDNRSMPKLLDLGSAREESTDGRTMTTLMTHGYAPYEQYSIHGNQGPWTDIYAICASIYTCLTGKIAPDAITREEEDDESVAKEMDKLAIPHIREVIVKGMSSYYDDRYQSITELTEALTLAYSQTKEDEQRARELEEKQEKKKKQRGVRLILASTLVVFVVLVAGIVIGMNIGKSEENISDSINEESGNEVIGLENESGEMDTAIEEAEDMIYDAQRIYLKRIASVSDEEATQAEQVIKKRLSNLIGANDFEWKEKDSEALLEIALDNWDDLDMLNILDKHVLSPARLSIVYDKHNFVEITSEDVVEAGVKLGKIEGFDLKSASSLFENDYEYISIKLSEDCAKKLDEVNDCLLTEKYRNLPGYYSGLETYNEKNGLYEEVESGHSSVECLYVYYDFMQCDLYDYVEWKNLDAYYYGYWNKEERTFSFIVKNNSDLKNNIMVSNLLSESFIRSYDYVMSTPVLWERESDETESICEKGENQTAPEYFAEMDLTAVDVIYENYSSDSNYYPLSSYYSYNKVMKEVLDKTGIPYAVGRIPGEDYNMVVRLPSDSIGLDYVKDLTGLKLENTAISLNPYERTYEYGDGNIYNHCIKDFDFDSANRVININLKNREDIEELYQKDFDEFLVNTGKYNNKVYWPFENDNYCFGLYDRVNNAVVLDQSTFSEDATIPDVMANYIDLLNILSGYSEQHYHFSYEKSMWVTDGYVDEDSLKPGMTNCVGEAKKQKSMEKLSKAGLGDCVEVYTGNEDTEGWVYNIQVSDGVSADIADTVAKIISSGVLEDDGVYSFRSFSKVYINDDRLGVVFQFFFSNGVLNAIRFSDMTLDEEMNPVIEAEAIKLYEIFKADDSIKKGGAFKLQRVCVNHVY